MASSQKFRFTASAPKDSPSHEGAIHEVRAGSGRSEKDISDDGHAIERLEIVRILFVALAAAVVGFHLWEPFPHISVIGIAATLIGGYPIFKEAFENIVERKMTMELSMTIALLSALAIGEFFTTLVITGFVLVAEVLESLTVGRGRRAIQDLVAFLPRTVTVRRDAQVIEIAADQVQVGDAANRHVRIINRGFDRIQREI